MRVKTLINHLSKYIKSYRPALDQLDQQAIRQSGLVSLTFHSRLGFIGSVQSAIMTLDDLYSDLSSRYDSFAKISNEVHLFWSFRDHYETIDLAVSYHLPRPFQELNKEDNTTNARHFESMYWLGFGLTPQGGMIGADMFLYLPPSTPTFDTEQEARILLDVHGVAYSFPEIDRCGQDWHLVNASSSVASSSMAAADMHVVVEVTRAVQSNDVNEDLPFINDTLPIINPTQVIAAWGLIDWDGNQEEIDGRRRTGSVEEASSTQSSRKDLDLSSILKPHGPSGRMSGSVRFFANSSSSSSTSETVGKSEEKQKYIDLVPTKTFHIPGEETTYKNYCFSISEFPDLLEDLASHGQVHIIGFRDLIGNDAGMVHHMDLHGTSDSVLGADTRLCRTYLDLIHPWEAGSPTTFTLPLEAGIPLGGEDGYKAFRVEVHYHNPRRQSGLIDRSGVRLYYTVTKRPHVAGLMLLGDHQLKLRGTYTVGSARKNSTRSVVGMRHSFYCPPSCFFGSDDNESLWEVTVFREVLHMHRTGVRMTNINLNSKGSVKQVSEANRFDFSQGAGFASRSNLPYRIGYRDSFITTCYFAKRSILWGSSSGEEMCQAFLWYYPKQEDKTLSCGYFDPYARTNFSKDTLSSFGCEMGYDRSEVRVDTNFDRYDGSGSQCLAAVSSKRPIDKYPVIDLDFEDFPSLVSLLRSWKKNKAETAKEGPDDTKSMTAQTVTAVTANKDSRNRNCTLCIDGSLPTNPNMLVPGFSWTCNELDAAVPVLFSHPELLFLSASDVASCTKYQESFGKLCGCPALAEESSFRTRLHVGSFRGTIEGGEAIAFVAAAIILSVVLFSVIIIKRRR